MQARPSRRSFLRMVGGAAAGLGLGLEGMRSPLPAAAPASEFPFRISLAEWSLNKTIRAGKLDNLDFPAMARRTFGIEAVEFVDQFFSDKAEDERYLRELKKRAGDEGVDLHLIMVDTAGPLGAADRAARDRAVEMHSRWVDAAKLLGCRTVRVNARGEGPPEALAGRIVESCGRLAEYAGERGIQVAIENHGGPSSDPEWLAGVCREVARENFGALPDFGNFPPSIDRYDAVETLMPHAKAVSAKASRFDERGLVVETDFFRMMRIVRDEGYRGYVGVESGASSQDGEAEAVRRTKALLERIFDEQRRARPLFNGTDLTGWVQIEGGDWTVDEGVLVGRNGRDWAVDAERTGSWLRTEREYGDFILELQYDINAGQNSGVFFRSAAERNPAFTGYEMQIVGRPDAEPGIWSPTAICMLAVPTRTVVREPGRWNSITITARGDHITIVANGEKVIDTTLDRSRRGYLGLQNHDERSVVKFRNIRVTEL